MVAGECRRLVKNRQEWDKVALILVAHIVARLGGVVQHVRRNTNAVGAPGA